MRVFSPQVVKEKHNERETLERTKFRDLSEKTLKATKELNDILQHVKQAQDLRNIVLAEKEASIGLLEEEVKTLEERKKIALEPLTEIRIRLEARSLELDKKQAVVERQETALDRRDSELLDKLELIEERNYKIANKEEELDMREDGVERQEDDVNSMTSDLQKSLQTHRDAIIRFNRQMDEQNARNAQIEHSLMMREKAIANRELELTKEERILADQRGVLERATKRLKK